MNSWYDKLERRWVAPAYGGGSLLGIGLAFFGAATNTMSGWLYVLSGTIFALLFISAILPIRAIKNLDVRRSPIMPVSVGEVLQVKLTFHNQGNDPKSLVSVTDIIPPKLGSPHRKVIEFLPPLAQLDWLYELDVQQRGIFDWHTIELRTANPFGLFWCRRSRQVPGRAIVYPEILPLSHCPIIDSLGEEDSKTFQSERLYQASTEGITKAIRNYRRGDPMRLIHWRSSARFGDLKVRELEITTGGEEVIICLDHLFDWQADSFEQAASAAASLFFYGQRSQLNVKFWAAHTGILNSRLTILEALAGIQPQKISEPMLAPPKSALIWLTQNPASLHDLPRGSRWIFFARAEETVPKSTLHRGLSINTTEALQLQLQKSILNAM